MGTAYDAILKNLSATAKIRAGSSRAERANAEYISKLKIDFLRNINTPNPSTGRISGTGNATRDLALSVMDHTIPTVAYTPPRAVPTSPKKGKDDFKSGMGKFFKGIGEFTGADTGFSAIGSGIKEAFSTGPGKWAIRQLQRTGQTVGGAADYLDTHQLGDDRPSLDPEATSFLDAARRGWTNKSHIYPGTVLKKELGLGDPTKDKNFGEGALEFLVGLTGDVVADPLSFLPVGKIGTAAGNAARRGNAARQADSAFSGPVISRVKPEPTPLPVVHDPLNNSVPINFGIDDSLNTLGKASSNTLKSPAKQFLDKYYNPIPEGVGKELELFKPPRFAANPSGIVDDATNPVSFADEILSKKITSSVTGEVPLLAHPGLEISSPFREVVTESTQRVPKVITEEVPNVAKSAPVAKAKTGVDAKTGKFRATKMALLQAPDHKLKSGLTVAQLLEAAKTANPKRLRDIKSALHQEAVRIFNEGAFDELPKITAFKGRSGNAVPAGLTIDQAADLFTRGELPAALKNYDAPGTNEFLEGYPLHSVEDLKNLHLTNSSGQVTSLHDYLKDYNMPVKSVHPDGTVKDVLVPKPKDFDLGEIPDFSIEPKTKKVSRTIYEDVVTKTTSLKRIKGAEALAWQLEHSGKLTPAELKYISHPSLKPETFEARVAELRLKTVAGNFKTLKEFLRAARAGEIPQEFIDEMFKNLGLKNLDDLEKKATALLKKTGPKKPAPLEFKIDEVPGNNNPVERVKTKVETEWDRIHEGVQTPKEIIDRVATEGAGVLERPRPEPSPTLNADVEKALKDAIRKNIKTPQTSAYPYRSNRGTLRTDSKLREGVGRNLKGWNAFSQGDALSSLILSASSRIKKAFEALKPADKRAAWRKRSSMMYDQVMPAIRVIENHLADKGVKIIAGKDESGILMSLGDVLESLPRHVVEKTVFTPPGAKTATIRPTGISNAAEPLVRAALHEGDMALAKEAAYQALMDVKTGGSYAKYGAAGQKAARDFVDELISAMPILLQRVNMNYAEHSIKVGQSVTSMTDAVIEKISQKVADPNISVADAFSALMSRDADIAAAGRAIGAPGEAAPLARVLADTGLVSKGIEPGDLAEAKTALAVVEASKAPKKELHRMFTAGTNQQKSRVAEAETLSDAMGEVTKDIMDYVNLRTEAGLFRSYVPILGKVSAFGEHLGRAYKTNHGFPNIHEALWGTRNTTMSVGRAHRSLMSVTSKYTADMVGVEARKFEQQAFKLLQQGGEVTDEIMIPIMNSMRDSIDLMFTAGEKGNASLAIRNGLLPEHLNTALDYFGAPKSARFIEGTPLVDQKDIWRTWENIDDPLDALDKIFAGYQFALTDSTVGRTFTQEFGRATPKEGYVKLTDKGNNSILHKFIDHEMYYPEEIAKQIPYYDVVRKASTQGIQNKNLAYSVHLYDTFLHGLKTGLTVVRPGHHASNLYGDMILNMLAGVTNPLVYRRGFRVLSSRSKLYQDWDGIKAMAADEAKFGAIPGKDIKVGKRGLKMTDDETWRAAYNEGLLGDFHQTQALDFNDAQQFSALAGKTGNVRKAGRAYLGVAGKVADVINHNVRMAQFIDVLSKSKATTLQDAIKEAGAAVRKWHPDGSDLTPFERKYMRRTVLFYSWMKKSTPLIVQSLLQKPGRLMVIPKAQYQFAQTMGMNPDAMADPFPQESVYPSFITDSITGPQFMHDGHHMGFGLPGDPIQGTVNQQMNNPLASILNGLTPAIKVPLELNKADGSRGEVAKSLGSGIVSRDTSDYVDAQIPILADIARITKFSPTGMEPQNKVTTGATDPGINKAALLNFLAGLGLKEYKEVR